MMKRAWRIFSIVGAVAAFALLAATGLTAQSVATGDVMTKKAAGQTITVWGWDSPEFNKKVEDYISSAAGVTVQGQTFAASDIMTKATPAAAAGAGLPDCFKVPNSNLIPKLVQMKAIKDLTDMVAPYKDLLPKAAWDMVTYNGRIWALPANSPAIGMFYRYDVLQKYGVDPRKIETWDQWIDAGKKVMAASGGTVSWTNGPKDQLDYYFTPAIFQANRAEEISADKHVAINSAKTRAALTLLQKIKDSKVSVAMDDWTDPWYQAMRSGSVACFLSGTWFVETIIQQAPDTQGKWYFTPVPALASGGDRYPNTGSALCVISSQTNKVDAAFEWCKAWTLDRTGSLEIGLKQLGISVVSNTALADSYVNAPHAYFALNQAYWKDATNAFVKNTYIPPNFVESSQADDIWGAWLNQWWLGKASTNDALAGAEKEMKSKLKLP